MSESLKAPIDTRAGLAEAETVVGSACRSHCGGACFLGVHVRGEAVGRIETDNGAEPQFRACAKCRAYRQRLYAPDRLRYPLKRVGERGRGEFARIGWDEALDTVASQIRRISKSCGSSAIAFACSMGDITLLHNAGLIETLLVGAGGYSGIWGKASNEGAWFAAMASYGAPQSGNTRDDFLNSRLIIMWGWDPAVCVRYGRDAVHLAQAREAGVRIVAVDPRYSTSAAAFAQQWIPVRPNTDAAMLIAMAHTIVADGLQDTAFIDRYTTGYDAFKDYVLGNEDGVAKTPAWAERITGVPAATIAGLAREYALNRPAALMDGFAPGRTAYGEQFHRAAIALAAITGNIGIHGGCAPGGCALGGSGSPFRLGAMASSRAGAWTNPVEREAPLRAGSTFYQKERDNSATGDFYAGGPSAARVNRLRLADAILKGKRGGYPADYKMLYLVNLNYVNQLANTNKIVRALKSLDFVVVQEQFMTATARFADILLPTNTFLERNDLTESMGAFCGYMNKAVESLGESKSHLEICTGLAERLGIREFARTTEEGWLREIVGGCKQIPDYDTFKKEGILKARLPEPFVAFQRQIDDPANNPFPSPSGKIEIYSQRLADMNNPLLPPIPKYIEPWEGRNDPLARTYPLQLITTHALRRANPQFDNVPWLRELYPQAVLINPADAATRGIAAGDMVRVFNNRGETILRATVTEGIMPGVVSIPQGAWYAPDSDGVDRGGCTNLLTRDEVSPGGAFASNTALVEVARLAG